MGGSNVSTSGIAEGRRSLVYEGVALVAYKSAAQLARIIDTLGSSTKSRFLCRGGADPAQ